MSKPRYRVYCPISLRPKMLFETEKKAMNFIKFNAEEFRDINHIPVRAYYCQGCGGWHLTHKEKWDE